MNTQFGRGRMGGSRGLEAELPTWLCSFEPSALPINARLRISADLRAQAAHPVRAWTRLPRMLSTAASVAVVLAWAALFLLAVTSINTASYGPGAPTGPEPIINPPTTDLGSPQWLADPLELALIVVASVLAGAAVNLRLVRSAARRVVFGSGRAIAAAPIPMRRRLRRVPRLALVLAMLPVINVVMQPYLNHPLMLDWSMSLFLPSALACVVAFRYPVGDRSVRWLLVGGFCLGLSVAMHLETYSTLRAIGWLALAVGLAARAGVANRPSWLILAATLGVVLYAETGSVISVASRYTPVDYVLPSLIYQGASACLVDFALIAIIWTAFTSLRSGGGPVWVLVLVAAAGLFGLQLYHALNMNIDLTYWLLPWVDPDTLANVLLTVQWLSFGALLAGLLIGLEPATPAAPVASEGTPQPDSGTSSEMATP